ncbi:hypothetical protein EDC96DRAFT_512702 [Choanephora cucurbitarum]|nr:hypothetical protein EDC96DRAFT_512702 [Choanephora cucurbitarum]
MCHLVLSSFIYLTFEVNSSYSLFCSEIPVQFNLGSCWFRFAKQKQDVPLSCFYCSFASFCWALVGYSKRL